MFIFSFSIYPSNYLRVRWYSLFMYMYNVYDYICNTYSVYILPVSLICYCLFANKTKWFLLCPIVFQEVIRHLKKIYMPPVKMIASSSEIKDNIHRFFNLYPQNFSVIKGRIYRLPIFLHCILPYYPWSYVYFFSRCYIPFFLFVVP